RNQLRLSRNQSPGSAPRQTRSPRSSRLRHRSRSSRKISAPRSGSRSQWYPPAQSLGVRTERHPIFTGYTPRRKNSRRGRLFTRSKRHPLPSHPENIHRRTSSPHRRRPAGTMAQNRNRSRTSSAGARDTPLRLHSRKFSAHFPALGRRKQRSRYF